MMQTTEGTAPAYGTLRPFKETETATFPVYHDLVSRLVAADEYPCEWVAHVMATCAGYAYSDGATVAMIMARLGLEENNWLMVVESVDAMFITSTAFLIQSKDGKVVILCYRGTPPTSAITWLTDIDIDPARIKIPSPSGDTEYDVHGGFYRNVRSTRHEIVNALQRALKGQSVHSDGARLPNELQALYITGHSLGGASAALLSVMLLAEPLYAPIVNKLKAVYTFGQPMIACPELAHECSKDPFLRDKLIRYVYANDIGPQFPPSQSGPFEHFGTEYQYRRAGNGGAWRHNQTPRKQMKNLLELIATPLSFVARQIKLTRNIPFHASVADHLPHHYITALTPTGVRSEFGD